MKNCKKVMNCTSLKQTSGFRPHQGIIFLTEPKEGEIKYFLKKLFPSPLGDYFLTFKAFLDSIGAEKVTYFPSPLGDYFFYLTDPDSYMYTETIECFRPY